MKQHFKVLPNTGLPLENPSQYRHLIERLLYVTVTKPDITFYVNYLRHPRTPHLEGATCVHRYLKGTINHGIFLCSSSTPSLKGYTDSDWAGYPSTRRSTTGDFTMLRSSPLSWNSKKQPIVSLSLAKAEYRALAKLTSKLQWLFYIFKDLGIPTQWVLIGGWHPSSI